MEHTACANCDKFVDSISQFHGGLTHVVHVYGNEVPFSEAFPPVVDVLDSKEGHYDELAK